jgi:TPR repeat protein
MHLIPLQDSTPALLKLGMMYEEGHGVSRNYEVALVHYKAAANRDDPVAQYLLGLNYRMGDLGLEQNYSEALKYLQKSAEAGFPSAQRVLGLMYSEGVGCPQDHSIAFSWFQKAAAKNDVRSIGLLGNCYEKGHGVEQDYERAVEYYEQAAEAGSDMAEYSMGQLLHMLKRFNEAFRWYQKAAKHERQSARLMVARYMLHGWGDAPHNPEAAFSQLKDLADKEDFSSAFFWVAACYEEGGGVAKDLSKAYLYYHKSANVGDVDGEFQVCISLQ